VRSSSAGVRGCQVALPHPETNDDVVTGRRAVSRGVARRTVKLTGPRELVSPGPGDPGGGSGVGEAGRGRV
jgi:hypothetical protein